MNNKQRFPSAARGFSLMEILVVVAIVGVLSLAVVPNFIQMQKSSTMRSSVRQFTSDMRSYRQTAISRNARVRLTFAVGPTATGYESFISTDRGVTWTGLTPVKNIDPLIYLEASTFTDTAGDARLDVIFRQDGTVELPAGMVSSTIQLRTDADIPFNQSTITIGPTGTLRTAQSHV